MLRKRKHEFRQAGSRPGVRRLVVGAFPAAAVEKGNP